MSRDSIGIQERTFKFAIKIFYFCKYIREDKNEFILSEQLLRSGTSIGANVREAQNAESKMDFIHKLNIAQKETDETIYWLELIKETLKIDTVELLLEANSIFKIIKSIIISTKKNLKS
ncbi:MAG TPA: four helix bundle protein [Candidatus Dojkabacteria bacterium]|nr:four helix bundle protein [Candidatus Dojkabacteria bacterium]HQF36713.1 four helix bundle protein [Candidatus Dojkabacteria bacterium]